MREQKGKISSETNHNKTISLEDVLELYKQALEETSLLVITDNEGKIKYANDSFCQLSGFSPQEINSDTHRIFKSGNHPEDYYQQLWETVKSGNIWRGELVNRKKNGELFKLYTTIFPFPAAPETPFQFLSISREISLGRNINSIRQNNCNIETELDHLLELSNSLYETSPDSRQQEIITQIVRKVRRIKSEIWGNNPENTRQDNEERVKELLSFDKQRKFNKHKPGETESKKDASREGKISVLIAEDVIINQMVMQKHLQTLNFRFEFASDGMSVLNKLHQNKYDVILMDMQMPVLGGEETIKRIRNSENGFKDIPIIAVTASLSGDVKQQCIEAGANDYLPKPFDIKELSSKINSLVSQKRKTLNMKEDTDTTSTNGQQPLYNLEYLEQLSEGDKEFTISMIKYFLDNTPGVMEAMKESYDNKDWQTLRNVAHKFKPQLNFMGINPILDDVEQIEQNAHKEKDLDSIPLLIEKTEEVCLKAIKQLKDHLDKLSQE